MAVNAPHIENRLGYTDLFRDNSSAKRFSKIKTLQAALVSIFFLCSAGKMMADGLFLHVWAISNGTYLRDPRAMDVREERVQFLSGGIALQGTLMLPKAAIPNAAVVLFHGSGPEGRNVEMAHWFAEQGIAALTYDKRGVGGSGGDFRTVPFTELCNDGLAAVAFLRSRSDIDAHRIGVWGLSQGGWLGPLAASRSKDIAFVIAVSGPGVSPGEQMLFYYGSELRAMGISERDIEEATALRKEIWAYHQSGVGFAQARADLRRATRASWHEAVKRQSDKLFEPLPTPVKLKKRKRNIWFQYEMTYDPTEALRRLRIPSLFIFGETDQLVPVPQSVKVIRSTLEQSGAQDFTIYVLPKLGHGMRTEQGDFAPEYLETLRAWLSARHFHAAE